MDIDSCEDDGGSLSQEKERTPLFSPNGFSVGAFKVLPLFSQSLNRFRYNVPSSCSVLFVGWSTYESPRDVDGIRQGGERILLNG